MYPEMEIVDCRANMEANFLKFLEIISNQQPESLVIYFVRIFLADNFK